MVMLMRRCEGSKTRHGYFHKQYHLSKCCFIFERDEQWTEASVREPRKKISCWPRAEFMHGRIMIFIFSIGEISVYEGK